MSTHTSTTPALTSSSMSTSPKKLDATDRNACSGHAVNQSNVQQLTNAGNMRNRLLKASPMGDIVITTCKLARHLEMKYLYISAMMPVLTPAALAAGPSKSLITLRSS